MALKLSIPNPAPLGNPESYDYAAAGNLTTFVDRRGKATTYTYDNLNRRTFAGFGTTSGPSYESSITYNYDAGNRYSSVVDSVAGTITPTFDGLNRLTEEQSPQGTVNYTYDAANRRMSMTVTGQTAVDYTYDNANRLTQITRGTPTVSFSYDNANRRTSVTLPDGVTMSYGYDTGSELTGITYTHGMTTMGNLTYSYDLAGRRAGMGGSYAATGLPQPIGSATYNANNQLTQWGDYSLYYDQNGNMTSDGANSYTWNARNQLASMNFGTNTFGYDGYGRRYTSSISSTSTNYLYDGANVVQELNGSTPTANILGGLGIDENFTRTDSTWTANYLTDALGSTIGLADSSGTIQTAYSYEPFGNTTVSGSSTTPYQYTGQVNDGTWLYFYRARYYSPTLQRFASEDPIGFGGGANLYAYAGDSPASFTDPSGLDKKGASGNPWPVFAVAGRPWLPKNQYYQFRNGPGTNPNTGPYPPNSGPPSPFANQPPNPTEPPPTIELPPQGLPESIAPTPYIEPPPPESHVFLRDAGDLLLDIVDALTEISDPILVIKSPCNCN